MRSYRPVLPTGNYLIDGILWGTAWTGQTIPYYFADVPFIDPSEEETVVWTDYEKSRIEAALASWSDVANLDFVRVDSLDSALFAFKLGIPPDEDDDGPGTTLGMAFPPGEFMEGTDLGGAHLFNHLFAGWDRTGETGTNEKGGYSYITLVHEIGHALGLAHPHDEGGGNSPIYPGVTGDDDPGLAPGFNRDLFTIMSYVNGLLFDRLWDATLAYGYAATPMAFDIAAIQHIYGANMAHRTGDDVYALADADAVGQGFVAIWDAGGTDTIRYDGTRDAIIDLRAATLDPADGLLAGGGLSIVDGVTAGFLIAHGVVIENAVGGSGNDRIFGNEASNTIIAGAGDDLIFASAGRDIIDGGAGFDVFIVDLGKEGVDLTVAGLTVVLSAEGMESHLQNIQFIEFSNGSTAIASTFSEAVTARLYSALFDRDADLGGYKYWSTSLDHGVTIQDIAALFILSDEAAPLRTALGNDDFIELLYVNALERAATVDDIAWWTDAMSAGMTRSEAALHFAAAPEASVVHAGSVIELFAIA